MPDRKAFPDFPELSDFSPPDPPDTSGMHRRKRAQATAQHLRRKRAWAETEATAHAIDMRTEVDDPKLSIHVERIGKASCLESALAKKMLSGCPTKDDISRALAWLHELPEQPTNIPFVESAWMEGDAVTTTVSRGAWGGIHRIRVSVLGYPDATLTRIARHTIAQGTATERVHTWCQEAYAWAEQRADTIERCQRADATAYIKRQRETAEELRAYDAGHDDDHSLVHPATGTPRVQ